MKKGIDPLFIIFEKKLYDNKEVNLQDFAFLVVREYLDFMKSKNLVIPDKYFEEIVDTLIEEVNTMLKKKIYGFTDILEYKKSLESSNILDIEKARKRYYKLKNSA